MAKIVEFIPPVKMREYFNLGRGKEVSFQNITLTLRGRDSISLAVSHFGLGTDDIALLPGYLCDTVTAVFAPRCRIEYYDINKDFSINPAVIEERLVDRQVKVLYIIHYFGFLHRNLARLSTICRKHNILLFEDHAHSALSRFSYEYGDVIIFSFRKVLPVPDGGGLWIKDLPGGLRIDHSVLLSDIISLAILAKQKLCYRSLSLRNLVGGVIQKNIKALNEGKKQISTRPISHMSRRIVHSTNLDDVFRIRREQFHQWQSLLRTKGFVPVFSSLPDDVCPQGYPIWISNPDEVVHKLEKLGIFLKIHWRSMPDEVSRSCPVSWRMSRSIVTLPIYPVLAFHQIQRIAALVVNYGKPAPGFDG